jgi:hypothetical protein
MMLIGTTPMHTMKRVVSSRKRLEKMLREADADVDNFLSLKMYFKTDHEHTTYYLG